MVNRFYITLAIYGCKYNALLEYCATIESLWTVIHQFTITLFIFLWCLYAPHVNPRQFSPARLSFLGRNQSRSCRHRLR